MRLLIGHNLTEENRLELYVVRSVTGSKAVPLFRQLLGIALHS